MLLHDREELDDDLGGRSDQDLSLSGFLGIVDALQAIVEDGCSDHGDGVVWAEILKSSELGLEVSAKDSALVKPFKRKECPAKGSSACVARDEGVTAGAGQCYKPFAGVTPHLRLGEERIAVDVPRENVLC